MIVLQVRIHEEVDQKRFCIEVERLLREDATERECTACDNLHDVLKESFERNPNRVGPVVEVKGTTP